MIVVLATHWLGDTFWALQIVPWLERTRRDESIHVLVRPANEWLARLWVPVGHAHAVRTLVSDRLREGVRPPWSTWGEARRLRDQLPPIDLAIDLTATPAAGMFVRALGSARAIGAGGRGFTRMFYQHWQPLQDFSGHLARRPWWIIEALHGAHADWPTAEEQLRPHFPGEVVRRPRSQRELPDEGAADPVKGSVLLFPGAGWSQKRWPLDRYVELGRELSAQGHRVLALFAESEVELLAETRLISQRIAPQGRLELRLTHGAEMLELLTSAPAAVANDSGAAHLAAALGVPTVVLFGPTNPAICGALGERVRVVRACCPDRPEGQQHHCLDAPGYGCGRECMRSIDVADVLSTLGDLLGSPTRPQ